MMAAQRLTMRKIREVLRLHFVGSVRSARRISIAIGCGKTAVLDTLRRANASGLKSWDDVEAFTDVELEQLLYPSVLSFRKRRSDIALPDWKKVHEELRRRDHQITLALLWTEYKSENPSGFGYSRYAELYRLWVKKLSVVMRQIHLAGEKTFVDYCDGLFIVDPHTGERTRTQLYVGVLGASSYTFAEATLTQQLPDWLLSHVRMYEFFGGVSPITVPDNLRSGVTLADRYEAGINRSYQELAEHYGTCIIPARAAKPKDKAKVEVAVLVAQRWILAVLRNRTFYSLKELNDAIALLLEKLNTKIMRHLKQSRKELFERLDKPALKALPAQRYEFAEWKRYRLNIDYHINYDDHFYSAPHTLIQEELWCRAGYQIVEILYKGTRIASHVRSFNKFAYSTMPEHRPASHREHAKWTPARIIEWGSSTGPHTEALIKAVIESKPHPEQGYRSSLGIIRLVDKFGKDRLEKAAQKALLIGSPSYKTVKTMLQRNMESAPLERAQAKAPPKANSENGEQLEFLARENVRGQDYYH